MLLQPATGGCTSSLIKEPVLVHLMSLGECWHRIFGHSQQSNWQSGNTNAHPHWLNQLSEERKCCRVQPWKPLTGFDFHVDFFRQPEYRCGARSFWFQKGIGGTTLLWICNCEYRFLICVQWRSRWWDDGVQAADRTVFPSETRLFTQVLPMWSLNTPYSTVQIITKLWAYFWDAVRVSLGIVVSSVLSSANGFFQCWKKQPPNNSARLWSGHQLKRYRTDGPSSKK